MRCLSCSTSYTSRKKSPLFVRVFFKEWWWWELFFGGHASRDFFVPKRRPLCLLCMICLDVSREITVYLPVVQVVQSALPSSGPAKQASKQHQPGTGIWSCKTCLMRGGGEGGRTMGGAVYVLVWWQTHDAKTECLRRIDTGRRCKERACSIVL